MKKASLAILMFIFALAFALSAGAETLIEEGDLGDTVSYKIVNYGDDDKPDYTLFINGSGSFCGRDTDGKPLEYNTRESSVFAEYAENITRVEVSDGIEEVGSYGLAFLKNVKEVIIPKSLKTVGNAAFQSCYLLESITVRGEKSSGFNLGYVTSIKNYAFVSCNSMRSVTLSEELTGVLGKECFANCGKLQSLTVPESIYVISENCFKNCYELYYVYIKGAPSIDSRAFSGSEYTYIVGEDEMLLREAEEKGLRYGGATPSELPYAPDEDSIAHGSAGKGLYWQLKKHSDYTDEAPKYDMFIDGEGSRLMFTTIWNKSTGYNTYKEGSAAKYLDGIINVYVETNSVTSVSGNFFTGMTSLKTVMLPSTVSSIDGAVFEHCRKLESVYLEGNSPEQGVFDLSFVKKISSYAFDGCEQLKSVIFSPDLENEAIGTETFKNCKNITTITIPAVITKIEKNAFLNCENLTEVIFELDSVIDARAFEGCKSLKTFRGYSGTHAEEYAVENGIEFLYPCNVAIRLVGSKKLIANIDVIEGNGLSSLEICGMICLLYTDPDGNKPYNMATPITDTTTLYAEPVYAISSLDIRTEGGIGMRASFSLIRSEGNDIYEITEVGAIATRYRGTSNAPITKDSSRIFTSVFSGKEGMGEHIKLPRSGDRFTFCATGFENEDGFIAERCAERLSFRGYVTFENRMTKEKHTFYTDMMGASLYGLAQHDKNVPSELKELRECEKVTASREDMLTVLTKIGMGEANPLLSSAPEIDDEHFFGSHLADEYEKNGSVSALVKFDINDLFDINLANEETLKALAREIKEYSEEGGSVMLYLRPDNPTNAVPTTSGSLSENDWNALFTESSPNYSSLLKNLGNTGMLLQFLKEEGVTVYVNLMPELATESRWWSAPAEKGGDMEEIQPKYIQLWRTIVSYYEDDCSLDNIIWVYEGGEKGDEYFPGGNYADIYGSDFESSDGSVTLSQIKQIK